MNCKTITLSSLLLALCMNTSHAQGWLSNQGTQLDWANPPTQCLENLNELDPEDIPNQPAIIDTIYAATKKYDMPPGILYGALRQESDLVDYGIIFDLGNYSCGIAQINISEWCQYVQTLSSDEREKLGWPSKVTQCDEVVKPNWLKPYYNELNKTAHIVADENDDGSDPGISADKFADLIRSKPIRTDKERAVLSFTRHCGHFQFAIPAKAEILRDIYDHVVPETFKKREVYMAGEQPKNWNCKVPYPSSAYPFQTGWLFADGIYNLGEELVSLVGELVQKDFTRIKNPAELIHLIKDSGKVNPYSMLLDFKAIDRNRTEATSWFRTCIVDRHITNVVNFSLYPEERQKSYIIPEECEKFKVKDNATEGKLPWSRLRFEMKRDPKFNVEINNEGVQRVY